MYLKRLDLHGFKSFPEKVKLEFNKGITTVVGPNGSGKSNVSDAVRWVLGEQKAKSLRGDKMEDVIFAGTQTRKPLGFAEVSITLDNQDHKMMIDYTEVTVTRRVFRSGESEYQINGTNCRLKDIHELFMDTGVGKEGYSIISQGRIDEILSVKGDDRRRIFEEAAGIIKYKSRKAEAVQRLEREQQNLQRVEDIISEMEGQIGPLERQSVKAKQYLQFREKLKASELSLFCLDMVRLESEITSLDEKFQIANDNQTQTEQEVQTEKEKTSQLRLKTEEQNAEIQRINDAMIEIRTELEKKEGEVRLTEQQIQNLENNIQRLQQEIGKKEEKNSNNSNEINLLETSITAERVSMAGDQERWEKLESEYQALSKTLTEVEAQAEDYKTEIIEQIKLSTEAKGDIDKREAMTEQFRQRQNQLDGEQAYLESQMESQKTHLLVLEKQKEETEHSLRNLKTGLEELSKEKEEKIAAGQKLTDQIKELERKWNEKKSRFSILSDMEKEHEGYFKSVKSILKLKDTHPRWQGICGAVGELLHVEQRYETAIESALGGAVQNVVTKTEEDAKEAIQYLKSNHLGRATFLPVSAVKGKSFGSEKQHLMQETGVIGVASDLVSFDREYEAIFASLLGKTLVMNHLEDAVVFAKKFRHQYRIVTLDGDILNPGGAMTGGSAAKKTSNIFGRSREIKNLGEELAETKEVLSLARNNLHNNTESLEQINQEILEKKMEQQKQELSFAAYQEDKEKTEKTLTEQQDKLKLYDLEASQLKQQLEKADSDIQIHKEKLEKAEAKISQLNQKLDTFQDSVESDKVQRDTILSKITDLKINISKTEQNIKGILQNKKRLQDENLRLVEEKVQAQEEIEKIFQDKLQRAEQKEAAKKIAEQMKDKELEKQKYLTALAEERKQLLIQIEKSEQVVQEKGEVVSQLKNELFRLEVKKEKVSDEKQRRINEIWEEYEYTYQMAKEFSVEKESYGKLKQEVRQWKESIKELGSVNVGAIEQYKEVKERFEFLSAQREDIINAEEKLQGIIEELADLMEQRFKEQFAVISNNFNEVFQEMFGGGKAYLKLTDETAVLDSPIEIIAQPPGKSLQSMMLLSGGERALTAIAILFSILKMKPSPFCILDEIEAALDDANVKRYANYLKKFAGDTQFIVITHRKGTMEVADVMYGVTMQEKGISKIISVDFSDKEYV